MQCNQSESEMKNIINSIIKGIIVSFFFLIIQLLRKTSWIAFKLSGWERNFLIIGLIFVFLFTSITSYILEIKKNKK